MRQYKQGDEILPGVVYQRPVGADHSTRITSGKSNTTLTSKEIEALEAIADELASLRARVPSEWIDGEPNWRDVDAKDVLQVMSPDGFVTVGRGDDFGKGSDGNWRKAKHRIIPYVSPSAPEKPKTLTVDDLPTFDGRVIWVEYFFEGSERWDVKGHSGFRVWSPPRTSETLHDAVQVALDAIAAGKLDRWLSQNKTR